MTSIHKTTFILNAVRTDWTIWLVHFIQEELRQWPDLQEQDWTVSRASDGGSVDVRRRIDSTDDDRRSTPLLTRVLGTPVPGITIIALPLDRERIEVVATCHAAELAPALAGTLSAIAERWPESGLQLQTGDARDQDDDLPEDLTGRDRDIVKLFRSEHSYKEIGEKLYLTEKTVRNIVSMLRGKYKDRCPELLPNRR